MSSQNSFWVLCSPILECLCDVQGISWLRILPNPVKNLYHSSCLYANLIFCIDRWLICMHCQITVPSKLTLRVNSFALLLGTFFLISFCTTILTAEGHTTRLKALSWNWSKSFFQLKANRALWSPLTSTKTTFNFLLNYARNEEQLR